MLLKAQALPADLLKGWEAEIVETTTLDGSVVKYAPTGTWKTIMSPSMANCSRLTTRPGHSATAI